MSRGAKLEYLLANSPSWVHRRVDSLRLDTDGSTRRFVSVDLTVPQGYGIDGSSERIIVPLGVLEKGPKQRLDTSYDGKPIPVLSRADNSSLVADMLESSQPAILRGPKAKARDLFVRIASCTPENAEKLEEEYIAWSGRILKGRKLPPDEDRALAAFDALVGQMARNFVLLVEVDESLVARRVIMKYALDQAEPDSHGSGTKRLVIAQPVYDLGFSASHHMEVEVPAGLLVESLTLGELGIAADGSDDRFATAPSEGRIAHVNIEPSGPIAVGVLRAEIAVARQGIFSFTEVTVASLVVLVTVATVIRVYEDFFLRGAVEIPSPAASILLVGPALLISWMSRLPEHPLVARMVLPLRNMLFASAIALISMAALAAVKIQPLVWFWAWAAIILLTAALVIRLLAFRFDWQFKRGTSESEVEYKQSQEADDDPANQNA
jgi:hypothetical protein